MDEEEYNNKLANLKILKGIQGYLKSESRSGSTVYPINVPEDMLVQVMRSKGADGTDKLIHHIFKIGLAIWSEKLFSETFGSSRSLQEFIDLVKRRNSETR